MKKNNKNKTRNDNINIYWLTSTCQVHRCFICDAPFNPYNNLLPKHHYPHFIVEETKVKNHKLTHFIHGRAKNWSQIKLSPKSLLWLHQNQISKQYVNYSDIICREVNIVLWSERSKSRFTKIWKLCFKGIYIKAWFTVFIYISG